MAFQTATRVAWMILVSLAMTVGCTTNPPEGDSEFAPGVAGSGKAKSGSGSPTAPRQSAPATMSDTELAEELRKAAGLQKSPTESLSALQNILATVSPRLPAVPVMTDGVEGRWHKVTLNKVGAGFDAIRFSSPIEVPGDVIWAIAYENEIEEASKIIPAQGKILGTHTIQNRKNVVLDGVELKKQNSLVLQTLRKAEFAPGKTYFLRFLLASTEPIDLYIRIKVIPAGDKPLDSVEEIAKELGISLGNG